MIKMKTVYVVYTMESYMDGEFPIIKGVYDEPQELKSDEYQDEVTYYAK
jgi:hypothetical protein